MLGRLLRPVARAPVDLFLRVARLQCGIVGLPNVGKSTLFNALTSSQRAEAANYPFCTIEPNIGIVAVPDPRLDELMKVGNSAKKIGAQMKFVDIAGLVRGASKGAGLGNKFLSHVRAVDAILHVVRCFENTGDGEEITHVDATVDPIRDIETIEMELLLSDLQSLERRIENKTRKSKLSAEQHALLYKVVERLFSELNNGVPARNVIPTLSVQERPVVKELQLITALPIIICCNVEEDKVADGANSNAARVFEKYPGSLAVSAKIESELANITDEAERKEVLDMFGLKENGLSQVIRRSFSALDLITFYTVGPMEARAWSIPNGTLAPQAAGVIHSDFEKSFIRAQTVSYDDFIKYRGLEGAKAVGKARSEGKTYVCKDGDVFLFFTAA